VSQVLKTVLLLLFVFSCPYTVFADDKIKSPWTDETEVGVTMVTGNSNTETYLGKQSVGYTAGADTTQLSGNYLQTRTGGVETSRVWKWSLRNEYALSVLWNIFGAYTEEGDFYGGIVQRDSIDLGAKFYFVKTDFTEAFLEEGLRYQYSQFWNNLPSSSANGVRSYFEVSHKLDDRVSGKLWLEYISNFTKSTDYQLNAEPSLLVSLTQVLSLKTAYSIRYHGLVPDGKTSYLDTIFTLSLIAKF
jgi:putative salt-induced outer membrane protein YdiY